MPNEPDARPAPPYESILIKAFDKLTSQVFIFLLAYVILVIGLGVLAPAMAREVGALLYVLPLVGVGGYIWQRRRSLTREARQQGIHVKAGMVTGEARLTGVRSAQGASSLPADVHVGVGLASGRSRIEGAVIGPEEPPADPARDAQYLISIFEQLAPAKRRKLIASAQQLLDDST